MSRIFGLFVTLLLVAVVVIGALIFLDVDVKDEGAGTEIEVHVPEVEFGSKEVEVTVPTLKLNPPEQEAEIDDDPPIAKPDSEQEPQR